MEKKGFFGKLSVFMVLIIAVALTVFGFAGCKQRDDESVTGSISTIKNMPTPESPAAKAITADMSAEQMMDVGFYNYYAASYVISENYSTNVTSILGSMDANIQYIDGYKIRKGVYNESDPLSSDAYHLVIVSGAIARGWEEALITGGEIKYRSLDKNYLDYNDTIGMIRIKDGAVYSESDYGSDLDKYNTDICNDPTKVFTYDIFDTKTMSYIPEAIESASEVEYDSEQGTYSFSIVFDKDIATKEYINVLERNLSKNGGKDVKFTSLKMDFVLWEDGHIKSISLEEKYDFRMVISMTNVYNADVYFAYDEQECGFVMADYKDAFTNNIAVERNNASYDKLLAQSAEDGLSGGEIAGICIGSVLGAALIAAAIAVPVVLHKKRKTNCDCAGGKDDGEDKGASETDESDAKEENL